MILQNKVSAAIIVACSWLVAEEPPVVPVMKILTARWDKSQAPVIGQAYKHPEIYVPMLIEGISNSKMDDNIFINPMCSTIGDAWEVPVGIRAAYVIEVVFRPRLDLSKVHAGIPVMGMDERNYFCNTGMIHYRNGKAISVSDLLSIQKIYRRWWICNSYKPIEEIRRQHKRNGVLDGTRFEWR